MRKTRSVAVLSALFLVLGMVMAAPAFATGCTIDETDGVTMTITVDAAGAKIVRSADNIVVTTTAGGAVACTSNANWPSTVFDIDSINVNGTGALNIDLSGGAFAPGFSTEIGTDEIEIYVTSGLNVTVNGTPAADSWDFLLAGVGVNGDSDADITGGTNTAPANLNVASLTANGLAGNDTFEQKAKGAGTVGEVMNGGDGTDTVEYEARTADVVVTVGAGADDGESGEADNVAADVETVVGGTLNDTISAPTGATKKYRFEGEAGNDTLTGGDLRDTLFGGAGNDTLNGGAARDFLTGGDGTDIENGGDGNDVFDQERNANGADDLNGGAGATDSVKYTLRTTGVRVTIGAGANDGACVDATCASSAEGDDVGADIEIVSGGREKDALIAATTTNTVYKLNGGAGNDTLTGGDNKDKLYGGADDDTAYGYGGGDVLSGSTGDDILLGGAGDDRLSGGSGDDTLNGEAGEDKAVGSSGSDKLWGDGAATKVKDVLSGGSQPSGGSDKCEVDAKDQRTGCEGKLTSSSAPASPSGP